MEYGVVDMEDVPLLDLSSNDAVPPDNDIRAVGDALGTDEMRVNVWCFDEGEEIGYHAHSEQEELFYVLDGEFSLKLGRSGDAELVEVGPGAFWAAGPMIGHGHRCISEDGGAVLAIGAPNVADQGLDPHAIDE